MDKKDSMIKKAYIITLLLLSTPLSAKQIAIPPGTYTNGIIEILHNEEIITNKTFFYLYIKLKKIDTNFRAGVFNLTPEMSYNQIVRTLQEKEGAASLVKLTIPEGYALQEIAETLEEKGIIPNAKNFTNYVNTRGKKDLINKFPFLEQVPTDNLEGYLYPDTYIFAQMIPKKQILTEFLSQFQKNILPLWESSPKKLSLHQTTALASIVEKETFDRNEMTTISGVFHNRLRKNMQLGACPTVSYALGKPRKLFLSYDDIKIDSPYNTYIHTGLPPTPIASPGKQAFEATLNPKPTSYLYFVANGDGTHTFTHTLKAHLNRQNQILNQN